LPEGCPKAARRLHDRQAESGKENNIMSKKLLAVAALVVILAGCVVVPARPVYYRPAPVVIY
jgi:hypothetical protein